MPDTNYMTIKQFPLYQMKQFIFSPLGWLSFIFVKKQDKFNVFATKLALWIG